MSKLIVTDNETGEIIEEFEIDRTHIGIGRAEDNDVCINSKAISSHHAKIITEQQDSFIQDLGSTNGTYANAKKVRSHALEHGDIITLGTHNLEYVSEPDSHSSKEAEDLTESARLLIKSGPREGDSIKLKKTMTTLGIPGTQVAAITHRHNGYFFTHIDGGDEQKTCMLNGEPTPLTPAELQNGDIIEVAEAVMEFRSQA
ncbi:MAG: FHA domain-containing protein [bacterium]